VTVRQVGVEEEMFLVDPVSRRLVASSDRAVAASTRGPEVEQELFLEQVETQSDPHRDLADVLADLTAARTAAATAASAVGAQLAAMPAPVVADDEGGDVTPKSRYRTMMSRYGLVARDALVCGMHVHVDVDGDDEGVAVVDRLRPWLPLVLAMSTGSPFHLGVDTSFASWRAEVWEAWPTAGATEPFGDAAGYHRSVEALVASGAALDAGMIYFDARLAASYPTVEVRVADVCADLADTAVVAAVVRALVDTCAEQWRAGVPVPPWRVEHLQAARWLARRNGLGGALLDPATGAAGPASAAVGSLLDVVGPALDRAGDRARVEDGLDRLLADGTGAARQRAVAGDGLDLVAVVDDVVRRTGRPADA
jgi:carboxylate-amine ligase